VKDWPCYGPKAMKLYSQDGVEFLYRAIPITTKESRAKVLKPHLSPSGSVFTWTGSWTTRIELIGGVVPILDQQVPTDVVIVPRLLTRKVGCVKLLCKLLETGRVHLEQKKKKPTDLSVLLGQDPIGTHHLFLSFSTAIKSIWRTVLWTRSFGFAGKTFLANKEYTRRLAKPCIRPRNLTPCGWVHFCAASLRPCFCDAGRHLVQ